MTTPHRTLREAAQMALDALLTGYHQGTQDGIAALREALAADHLRDVAEKVAPAAPVPDALAEAVAKAIYWEWRRDAGYVPWVDGGNSLKQDDARKIARAVVSSAAPVVREPRHVRKVGGSFEHTGTVVAEFKTLAGEPRIVLEFDAPVAGMLHVYRPDQVEPCEPAAPAQPVPLTDEQIMSLEYPHAKMVDFGIYSLTDDDCLKFARAVERAHGIAASPQPAPVPSDVTPQWTAADEAMCWLNYVEVIQGGANGPTIKLRAAILALANRETPNAELSSPNGLHRSNYAS